MLPTHTICSGDIAKYVSIGLHLPIGTLEMKKNSEVPFLQVQFAYGIKILLFLLFCKVQIFFVAFFPVSLLMSLNTVKMLNNNVNINFVDIDF